MSQLYLVLLSLVVSIHCQDNAVGPVSDGGLPPPPPGPNAPVPPGPAPAGAAPPKDTKNNVMQKIKDFISLMKRLKAISKKYCDPSTSDDAAGKVQACTKNPDAAKAACKETSYGALKTPGDRRKADCDRKARKPMKKMERQCIRDGMKNRIPTADEWEKKKAEWKAMTDVQKKAKIAEYKKAYDDSMQQMKAQMEKAMSCSEQALGIPKAA